MSQSFITPEDLRNAEKRGYAKGYQAGRKKRRQDLRSDQRSKERQAFLDKAFFAALPACVAAQGWTRGEKKITNLDDRTNLAWDFAEAAMRHRRKA